MFNTEELYDLAGQVVLGRRQKQYTDALAEQMFGRKAADALQIMIDWYGLDDTIDGLEGELQLALSELLDENLRPMPGLTQLLEALESAAIPFGIATSSTPAFVTAVLARFQWEHRFRFFLTGDDVANGKPDPEVYLRAAERMGVPAAEMIVLEDSPVGCQAAVSAGAYTVVVPSRLVDPGQFDGARFVARSLGDPRIYAALGLEVPGDPAEN